MTKYFINRPISLPVQLWCLSELYQESKGNIIKNKLHWTYSLSPTDLSPKYKVKIEYSLRSSPEIFIVEPKLATRENDSLPHVYQSEPLPKLCLYSPRDHEWNKNMLLAHTIVPWTCEWLYFYEIWLITGQWHADEVVHDGAKLNSF